MKAIYWSLGTLLLLGLLAAIALGQPVANGRDQQILATVIHKLHADKNLQNVGASVNDGIVTLQGTVKAYKDKLKAEKDARHGGHVRGVRDELSVNGPAVSDAELQKVLSRKLAYDRVGYGHVFDVLTLQVNDGVATVAGQVFNPVDRDSAIAIVSNQPGVKDVVDHIQVLPTSPFDDDIRIRTLRAIYSDPVLSRYAIDPQAPIRIVVDGGHVALYGMVDSAMDKQIAGLRANQVFGVFSVDNELTVPTQVQR